MKKIIIILEFLWLTIKNTLVWLWNKCGTSVVGIFDRFRECIDKITIVTAILVLILNFCIPISWLTTIVTLITAICGLIYVIYPFYLYFSKRIDFDWHLIHGHFLRKVCALVLLTPIMVSSLMSFFIDSPKEMVYETDLYTNNKTVIDTLGTFRNSVPTLVLNDTLYAKVHGYEIQSDSVVTVKNRLENISSRQKDPSLFWAVYYHFIDPGNQHMSTSWLGRIFAAIAAILGVFLLNGLLVSSIIGWVDRRKERLRNGDIDYKLKHLGKYRFAVVIGANEIATSVIRNLLTKPEPGKINCKCEGDNDYILLQTSQDVEEVRDMLNSYLTDEQIKKVVIIRSKRDSDDGLDKLYPEYATEIYVLGECSLLDGGESFHDSMNMRCVNLIAQRLENEKKNLGSFFKKRICKVLFEYQTTQSVFQFSDIPNNIKDNMHFIPFNRYESWARTVMVENTTIDDTDLAKNTPPRPNKNINYTPLDGVNGISKDSDKHVHFIVVGMSKMGVAMGLQAMLQCHYANYAQAEMDKNRELMNSRRTRITFIDTHADIEMDFFKGRYENLFSLTRHRFIDANNISTLNLKADSSYGWVDPMETSEGKWNHLSDGLGNFIDIEIEFVKGNLESEGVREYLRQISDKNNKWVQDSLLTVAVCLPKTHQAVAASLYMPIPVYEQAQEIWVYQREAADIIWNLENTETKDKRYKKLRPFGMIYGEYMSDRTLYLKSLMVNGAYNLEQKGKFTIHQDSAIGETKLRDFTQKETYKDLRDSWKKLSIDQKYSNKYFADAIYQKIRAVLTNEEYNKLIAEFSDKQIEHLRTIFIENQDFLAICEHNRWNLQQLLFGYTPCNKDDEKDIISLNAEYKNSNDLLEEWEKKNNWKELTDEQKVRIRKENASYKDLKGKYEEAKHNFKSKKDELKVGEGRVHPNICAFSHLDDVDFGAKGYDNKLNSIIPDILSLVDRKIINT